MEDKELPFTAHLEELRQRLKKSLIVVFVAFAVTIFLREEIFALVQAPMLRALSIFKQFHPDSTFQIDMHFKDPVEPFFTYMKVAFVAAIFVSVPFLLYQAWKFVAPGLYRHERRATLPFVLFSTIMFAGGAAFCHQIALPFGYYALLSYAGDGVAPMIMMREYTSITLTLLLAFGLVFETPVALIFACRIGLLTPAQLKRFRRYAIIVMFILGALLTPPDFISQVLLAIPLYLLYEIGILGARLLGKPAARDEEDPALQQETKQA